MSTEENEDDKATVVLSLDELNKIKEQNSKPIDASEIEFTDPQKEKVVLIPVFLFDLNSTFFQDHFNKFPKDYELKVIKGLENLNSELSNKEKKIIVFNYNENSKAVNQLCAQIKSRFPNVKTVIVAKGLSEEKAKIHQKSKSGANAYLGFPFTQEDAKNELNKLL